MSITTYSELQTEVASWLRRDDLTTKIPDFIMLAERHIDRQVRTFNLETSSSISITGGTAEYSLPTDFLTPINFTLNTDPIQYLHRMSEQELDIHYARSGSGRPQAYAIVNVQLKLKPTPDGAYTGNFSYHQKLPSLSNTQTTNFFLDEHADIYLYGALAHGYKFTQDTRQSVLFFQLFQDQLEQLRTSENRNKWGGSDLYTRTA